MSTGDVVKDVGKSAEGFGLWIRDRLLACVPWLLAAAALAAPWLLLQTLGGDAEVWGHAYWAGAFGGLVLELIRNRWRVELPSRSPKKLVGREESFAEYGPVYDIGVFGRMVTGALAAPTFLVIVNAFDTPADTAVGTHLAAIAGRVDTLGWAVLIGAVSPVVWSLGEQLVRSRIAVAQTKLDAAAAALAKAEDALAKEQLPGNGTPEAANRALLAAQAGDQEQMMAALEELMIGGGGRVGPNPAPRAHDGIDEALGAVRAAKAALEAEPVAR